MLFIKTTVYDETVSSAISPPLKNKTNCGDRKVNLKINWEKKKKKKCSDEKRRVPTAGKIFDARTHESSSNGKLNDDARLRQLHERPISFEPTGTDLAGLFRRFRFDRRRGRLLCQLDRPVGFPQVWQVFNFCLQLTVLYFFFRYFMYKRKN